MSVQNAKKQRLQGAVQSSAMNKSVVVKVERRIKHPVYHKYLTRTKTYIAHDETNQCEVGDVVEIIQSRPLSKLKHWAVTQILVKAK